MSGFYHAGEADSLQFGLIFGIYNGTINWVCIE